MARSVMSRRRRCCCFTGHRPEKLSAGEDEISAALERAIREAINDGFRVFLSGMARGVDIWAAEIVLKLWDEGLPIRLFCICPYRSMEQRWGPGWQGRYRHILACADSIEYICKCYYRGCYNQRNRSMVDRSSRIIAVYDGKPGGTRNTLEYAISQELQIVHIRR